MYVVNDHLLACRCRLQEALLRANGGVQHILPNEALLRSNGRCVLSNGDAPAIIAGYAGLL